MPPYRILIVDDSAFMRKVVTDIVTGDAAFSVVGTASNGAEAIESVQRLKPDAVTLDLEMPVMTGLEALPVIMREAPTPIVMMSSSTKDGTIATIRALELGAFDFVAKPSGPNSMDLERVRESLLATLHAAVMDTKEQVVERLQPPPPPSPPMQPSPSAVPPPSRSGAAIPKPEKPVVPGVKSAPPVPLPQAKTKPQGKSSERPREKPSEKRSEWPLERPSERPQPSKAPAREPTALSPRPAIADKALPQQQKPNKPTPARSAARPSTSRLVAIGTSTGGPRALQQVLTRLPAGFPAPVLVVQHMPAGFTKSLAQRLNTLCDIEVVEAEEGMEAMPGTAYIAPGGLHMTLRKEAGAYRIRLTNDPPRSGHRPSVDTLFESIASVPELDRTVVLMTGMGSDGAKGMKQLYDQGVRRTIAEDASSCIVYGMPRAAVELGCVMHEIPLDRIATQITKEVIQAEEV
ncbi:chemotaxis-specific protein-glutamate methyltransferase CheB [Paenibacillus sp. TRM 82003]|nr:chemotaxis-specific protein-glutamate methyltransferase CheB [Paenibacillus sp. TRM 82003]